MAKVLLFVVILAAVVHVRSQQDLYCDHPVDIAVLLDSSSSFGQQNFQELKSFSKVFINYLKLAGHGLGPHVAFLPYSSNIAPKKNMINFRYSHSVTRLTGVVNSILTYDGGKESRLDLALKGAREIIFQRNMGYRSWVPHVIVAVTGAWRTWTYDVRLRVQHEARVLREKGFQLLIATVGDVRTHEKKMFESLVESEDGLFMVNYAVGLVQVAKRMVQRLCPVPRTHPCPNIVDIAFIMDSSGSILGDDYRKMKYFVYSIANALNVSSSGAHAGVVIYSTHAELMIKFTDYTDIASFQKAVYGLKQMRKLTRIDLGLTMAHTVLFSPIYGGARPGVKKLAFILTDGKQNPDENGLNVSVAAAAKPLMDEGIKTFSIGIGSEVNRDELRGIVEYDEDVILAANFDELLRKIQNITEQTCEEIIYTKCDYPADIAFVLDSSSNVNEEDFALEKGFVRTMAKLFRIFQHGSRGAVIVFGERAKLSIGMGANVEYRNFISAVSRLTRVGGRRRTYKALELAEQVLTDYSNGARRKVPKVVLLLTAGQESDPRDTPYLRRVSRRLHDRNVLVLVVGIGPSLISAELSFIVQNSVNVFLAKSFSEIKNQLKSLSTKTCEEVGPGVCDQPLDLAFILDSSGSITKEDFDEAKFFVKKLAATFPISPEKTRIALLIYSDQAHLISRFGQITSEQSLGTRIDRLPHLKGKTRIDLALKKAGAEVFTRRGGMRESVAKVAIVITDGRQTPAPDGIRLDEAAATMLYHNVKVLSVGIGDKIDQEELNMMVENPSRHTFWAKSYSALRVQLATIARESCSNIIYTGRKF